MLGYDTNNYHENNTSLMTRHDEAKAIAEQMDPPPCSWKGLLGMQANGYSHFPCPGLPFDIIDMSLVLLLGDHCVCRWWGGDHFFTSTPSRTDFRMNLAGGKIAEHKLFIDFDSF
jgi:hypothetical protein